MVERGLNIKKTLPCSRVTIFHQPTIGKNQQTTFLQSICLSCLPLSHCPDAFLVHQINTSTSKTTQPKTCVSPLSSPPCLLPSLLEDLSCSRSATVASVAVTLVVVPQHVYVCILSSCLPSLADRIIWREGALRRPDPHWLW